MLLSILDSRGEEVKTVDSYNEDAGHRFLLNFGHHAQD
jgi:hypothetical protein